MHCDSDAPQERSVDRPRLEVAEIFRQYGQAYRQSNALGPGQEKVMYDIETCRTAVLGGHLDKCDHCGHEVPSYNSCLNRHCPKCQAVNQAKWIAQRKERILPTHYFHLVFTLTEQLRSLALCNRELLFDMLFASATGAVLELGRDPQYIGAQLGLTAVLHTWTRSLEFHPHLHLIVTGGGLDEQNNRWVSTSSDFLFPVKVLSRLFRGKFLDALNRAFNAGTLQLAGRCAPLADKNRFAQFKDQLYKTEWVVYAKRAFGRPEYVFEYLGRYTHRVAISNQRLISMDERGVTFHTKNGNTCTLEPLEFIRRFLLHVLPKGYVKIRHYGLKSATNAKTKLEKARRLIEQQQPRAVPHKSKTGDTWLDQILALGGADPEQQDELKRCPKCGKGTMRRTHLSPINRAYRDINLEASS